MNEYKQREKDNKQILADEFIKLGYKAELVADKNNAGDFDIVLNNSYRIQKTDYTKIIDIFEYPYKRYDNVSSYKQAEIRKETETSNNMKVLSKKKIDEKLAEINNYVSKMEMLELEYSRKIADFLFVELKNAKDKLGKDTKIIIGKDNKSGYIEKNGLMYEYQVCENGYIEQKITLR